MVDRKLQDMTQPSTSNPAGNGTSNAGDQAQDSGGGGGGEENQSLPDDGAQPNQSISTQPNEPNQSLPGAGQSAPGETPFPYMPYTGSPDLPLEPDPIGQAIPGLGLGLAEGVLKGAMTEAVIGTSAGEAAATAGEAVAEGMTDQAQERGTVPPPPEIPLAW